LLRYYRDIVPTSKKISLTNLGTILGWYSHHINCLNIWNIPLSDIGMMSEYNRYILANICTMCHIGWILVQYCTNMAVLLGKCLALPLHVPLIALSYAAVPGCARATRPCLRWPPWKPFPASQITGSAIVLTCYIGHSAKRRKIADLDPSGSQNPLTDFDKTWHGWQSPGLHPTWQLWWG